MLRAFWPVSQELDFSQIFFIEQIQRKLMTKFFFKLKTLFLAYFLPISPIFGAKKVFPKNPLRQAQLGKGVWNMPKFRET